MNIYFLIFIFITIYGIKFFKDGDKNYLDKKSTTMSRGFFTILIFFSHFNSYFSNIGIQYPIYTKIIGKIGQLMVTMFLFYSGYGIYKSCISKENYFKNFLKNRFLKTLFVFDLAVFMYLIVGVIKGNTYSSKQIILSFIGWDSLGNSNWFMFDILILYLITYIIAKIFDNKLNKKAIISITIVSLILIVGLHKYKQLWWYDTLLCYSIGMIYALYENEINKIFQSKYYLIILILATILFGTTYILEKYSILFNLINAIIFSLWYTIIMYKIKIGNNCLEFLGKYSYEIYILQRIPDILCIKQESNPVIMFPVCFGITIILSLLFKKFVGIVWNNKLIKENKK